MPQRLITHQQGEPVASTAGERTAPYGSALWKISPQIASWIASNSDTPPCV